MEDLPELGGDLYVIVETVLLYISVNIEKQKMLTSLGELVDRVECLRQHPPHVPSIVRVCLPFRVVWAVVKTAL